MIRGSSLLPLAWAKWAAPQECFPFPCRSLWNGPACLCGSGG